jgi:hypothetical protein
MAWWRPQRAIWAFWEHEVGGTRLFTVHLRVPFGIAFHVVPESPINSARRKLPCALVANIGSGAKPAVSVPLDLT